MKSWYDFTVAEQDEYIMGTVELHGFKWHCYYKFISEDTIEIYSEYEDYIGPSYTHYKSLVVED